VSETIEQRIERHEGLRLSAYRDSLGKLTIGVGRCLDTHPFSPIEIAHIGHDGRSKPITEEQAYWLLDRDIQACRITVEHSFPWATDMTQIRQEVLIEMVFQMGIVTLLKFVNTLAAMKAGNYDAAANGMLQSAWHSQTPARAEELANLMRMG
jgi:lysozyme